MRGSNSETGRILGTTHLQVWLVGAWNWSRRWMAAICCLGDGRLGISVLLVCGGGNALAFDVLADGLAATANTADEVVAPPERFDLLEVGELLAEMVGGAAFDALDEIGTGDRARLGDQQVDVIGHDGEGDDLDVKLIADLTEVLFAPACDLADEQREPVFRGEHEMQDDLVMLDGRGHGEPPKM